MNDYTQMIEAAKTALQQKLNAIAQINIANLEEEKAQYQEKIRQIDAQIQNALKAAGIEPDRTEQLESRKRSKKLSRLVEGSDEWNKVADQIATVMRNYPDGLNGRQIAHKLGLTEANAVMRVQPVIKATLHKTGQKASTKYFIR